MMAKSQTDLFDRFKQAEQRMEERFLGGERQQRSLLDAVAQLVIVDRLVPPKLMEFVPEGTTVKLRYLGGSALMDDHAIHRHALGQLCGKVKMPMNFVNMLNGEQEPRKPALLAHNLNELFHMEKWEDKDGSSIRFLHRLVGGEIRGFLSRKYNRRLASAPLLRAFVDACQAVGARPIEATSSPVRVSLKCLLPTVIEAFPGEFVCFGTEWTTSDFGAARLVVASTVWRVGSHTSSVLDDTYSKVHLGSIIEDSDIEMSDATALKELSAHQSAITDAVTQQLTPKALERLSDALRAAHDEKIPWTRLKGQLSKFLSKSDVLLVQHTLDKKGDGILDLPPLSYEGAEAVPNLYWASSAVSALANKSDDADRRTELQKEAGKLLSAAFAKAT